MRHPAGDPGLDRTIQQRLSTLAQPGEATGGMLRGLGEPQQPVALSLEEGALTRVTRQSGHCAVVGPDSVAGEHAAESTEAESGRCHDTCRVTAYLPPGWPAQVPPPGVYGWEQRAVAWLLDLCPHEYRGYPVLQRHPLLVVRLAARHVAAQQAGIATAVAPAAGRPGRLPAWAGGHRGARRPRHRAASPRRRSARGDAGRAGTSRAGVRPAAVKCQRGGWVEAVGKGCGPGVRGKVGREPHLDSEPATARWDRQDGHSGWTTRGSAG